MSDWNKCTDFLRAVSEERSRIGSPPYTPTTVTPASPGWEEALVAPGPSALPDDSLGVGIGDVAGHGLDAVAHMASARFSLRALALNEARPNLVLDQLNQVVQTFEGDTMIMALYGVINPHRKTWTYASAGHVPAVLRSSDGTSCLLDDLRDPPLGVGRSFRAHEVTLGQEDVLVLYTDGLIERRADPLEHGLDRLRRACEEGPPEPESLCDSLIDSLFQDQPNEDDVAVIAVALT